MDNHQIADAFSLLSRLMDIHGENSFKSKSYSSAAFAIEKMQDSLAGLSPSAIAGIRGIGSSSAGKITEMIQTGKIISLEKLLLETPPGVLEMLNIKGIGPKKIHVIWKEMGIESIGELLYACRENRLKLYKGFGEKTQNNIIDTIEFYLKNKESHLYAHAELLEPEISKTLENIFGNDSLILTGQLARQTEIIDSLEYVISGDIDGIKKKMSGAKDFEFKTGTSEFAEFTCSAGIDVKLYASEAEKLVEKAVLTACSPEFAEALKNRIETGKKAKASSEAEVFSLAGLRVAVPAFLREDPALLMMAEKGELPVIIEEKDIRGLIHCHSTWSDGSNSPEELARACMKMGLEYMALSDHSKSAFYAQGLHEDQIKGQHIEIDRLNIKLAPFRIFKSIECDILNDGSLDYTDRILSTFDLVIASIHSNLKMQEEKAMERLIRAIENPYTTILGHMTGRLLLSRSGYPVNHRKIIDACAANKVVIELNANPHRLDIDRRHIGYALDKGVMISINPDAHVTEGIMDIRYGVLQARKALLPPEMNLSSKNLKEFEIYLDNRKTWRRI